MVPSGVQLVFRWTPLVAWWMLPGTIESCCVPLVVVGCCLLCMGCYDAAVCPYALVRMQDHNNQQQQVNSDDSDLELPASPTPSSPDPLNIIDQSFNATANAAIALAASLMPQTYAQVRASPHWPEIQKAMKSANYCAMGYGKRWTKSRGCALGFHTETQWLEG